MRFCRVAQVRGAHFQGFDAGFQIVLGRPEAALKCLENRDQPTDLPPAVARLRNGAEGDGGYSLRHRWSQTRHSPS